MSTLLDLLSAACHELFNRVVRLATTPWKEDEALDVRGRAVFISGCDSGFGFSAALFCRQHLGMVVIAGCHGSHSRAGAAMLREAGCRVVENFDVTDDDSIARAVAETEIALEEEACDGLFCLVNNAAALVFAECAWQTPHQVRKQFDVNAVGPILLSKAMLHLIKKGEDGRIVNATSASARSTVPRFGVYSASKAALEASSAAMRAELRPHGVQVILIDPGNSPDKTPLCGRQRGYHQEICSSLTARDEASFGQHFRRCSRVICNMFPDTADPSSPPSRLPLDHGYYRILRGTVTDRHPSAEYANQSNVDRLRTWLADALLPAEALDRMKMDLIPLPKYEEQEGGGGGGGGQSK